MFTGDLSDFSLREILQFLATTVSSGVLELRSVQSRAGIAFHEGSVCVALLDMGGIHGLAARMLRAGAVDVPGLAKLGSHTAGNAIDLAAALARATAGDDAAADVFTEHTFETLGWLTRSDDAQFRFERSSQLEEWPFEALELSAALAEVELRAADWDELEIAIGDLARVCSAVPDVAGIDEISLTPEQWRVLALIDGRRQLRELIELTGMGHLATCRQLNQLVVAGLVELVEPTEPSTLDALLGGLDALRPHHAAPALDPTTVWRPESSPGTHADDRQPEPATADRAARVDRNDDAAVGRLPQLDVVSPGAATDENDVAVVDEEPEVATPPSDANRALFDRLIGRGGFGA